LIPEEFAEQSDGRLDVAAVLNDDVQYGSFTINRSPKINHLSIYLGIDFIQMPDRRGWFGSRLYPFCLCGPELVDPSADGFVSRINTAFDHEFFDITKTQIEVKIHPNGTANNIRMEAVAKVD